MTRAVEQVGPEKPSDVLQNPGVTRRVQPVTAEIDRQSTQFEARGISADYLLLLKDRGVTTAQAVQLVGGAQAGRSRSEDDDAGLRHNAGLRLESVLSVHGVCG